MWRSWHWLVFSRHAVPQADAVMAFKMRAQTDTHLVDVATAAQCFTAPRLPLPTRLLSLDSHMSFFF